MVLDLEGIVGQFTRLHYSSAQEIVFSLANHLSRKSANLEEDKDYADATHLLLTAEKLYLAAEHFGKAWEICKPHMDGKEAGKHNQFIKHYENKNSTLGADLANMNYQAIAQFTTLLANNVRDQADADLKRGRTELSIVIHKAYQELALAGQYLRNYGAFISRQ